MRTILIISALVFSVSAANAAENFSSAVSGGVKVAPQPPRADNASARPAPALQPLRLRCQPKTDVYGQPLIRNGRVVQECWAE